MGVKPLLSFSGTQWESPMANAYTIAKNILVDFFRGPETQTIDVEGLQLLINFCVGEEGQDGEKPGIFMRCWRILTKRSGQKLPRVEVEEMGPRIDFRVGRVREAEQGVWKVAMRRVKGADVRVLIPARYGILVCLLMLCVV